MPFYEHALYTKREGQKAVIVAVYVDDLLIMGSDVSVIEDFKKRMNCRFEMSNLEKLSYYLEIEVTQGKGFIELKQTGYAKKLLMKTGMSGCNPTKFSMDTKEQISKDAEGEAVNATDFKSIVGGLRYLVHTRPDIAYAVGVGSRYMERPTIMHMNAVKRILRYIQGTVGYGLMYSKKSGNNILTGYTNSDLAGHLDDRKSTGGMVFYLNESLITWVSQK